jgi:hypothetical protein
MGEVGRPKRRLRDRFLITRSASVDAATGLVKNQAGHSSRRVQLERDLRVHDLQEERSSLLRENLEARLVGLLLEEAVVCSCDLDDESRRDLVTADISFQNVRLQRDLQVPSSAGSRRPRQFLTPSTAGTRP